PLGPRLVDRAPDLLDVGCVLAVQAGGEGLERRADFTRTLHCRLARDLLAPAPAIEEAIARRPEALPQRLRLPARRRPAAFPFGLQLLDRGRGRFPVGGVRERFGLLAERRFLLRVPAPLLVDAIEVLLASREEAIAGLTEGTPERRRVLARHRADLLPVGLEPPDHLRRLVPRSGLAERRGLRAERPLLLEVAREVCVAPPAQLVASRPETLPQRLRLVCGRAGHLRPFLLHAGEEPRAFGGVCWGGGALGGGGGSFLDPHGCPASPPPRVPPPPHPAAAAGPAPR